MHSKECASCLQLSKDVRKSAYHAEWQTMFLVKQGLQILHSISHSCLFPTYSIMVNHCKYRGREYRDVQQPVTKGSVSSTVGLTPQLRSQTHQEV